MSYTTGEDLIVARIKEISGYDGDNVSQANWGVLDSGKSTHYAICKSGGNTPQFITPNVYADMHRTIIEVWQEYKDDGTSASNLYAEVEKIKAKMQDSEKLGDTNGVIQNSEVEEVREVQERWGQGGGPFYLQQDIVVMWREQVTAS